jgi:peptidoglycan/xylan/chitin deacetylase (PgdA/CDA1 family)
MKLAHHGRFPYSPIVGRPDFHWPGQRRLAVYVALNLECFEFGAGAGATIAPYGDEPDVLNYAWREYGNRVGAYRLLQLFDDLGWPFAALLNSTMLTEAPELVAACTIRKAEIVGHGRTNSERQGTLPEADERKLIAEATDALRSMTGNAPSGWLGPWISQSRTTPDLLSEAGYQYLLDWCHDDQPTWMKTRSGRILSVPYPQELNDIPQVVARKREGNEFADMIVDTFEVLLEEAQDRPIVMGIALHAYIVGWPHRFKHLRRALKHISSVGDPLVWITTPGQIARAYAATGLE